MNLTSPFHDTYDWVIFIVNTLNIPAYESHLGSPGVTPGSGLYSHGILVYIYSYTTQHPPLMNPTVPSRDTGSLFLFTATNLNITAVKKPAARIAETPTACETGGAPALVTLPLDVLSMTTANASEPINIVMYSLSEGGDTRPPSLPLCLSSVATPLKLRKAERSTMTLATGLNIHGAPPATTTSSGVAKANLSSPLVSFSLRQGGGDIKVNGTATPINISVPLSPSFNSNGVCVGQPANGSTKRCGSAFECRFWDRTSSEWSSQGCRTLAGAEGTVMCECDHLTDFVVFEFPTNADELLAAILEGIAVNVISLAVRIP